MNKCASIKYKGVGFGLGLALMLFLGTAVIASAGETGTAKAKVKAKPYPLKVCAVSGEKLSKSCTKQYAFDYKGQEVKLCCEGCLDKFTKAPSRYLEKISRATSRQHRALQQSGWTLERTSGVFPCGDAPSSLAWK